jgi:hypothetical protein
MPQTSFLPTWVTDILSSPIALIIAGALALGLVIILAQRVIHMVFSAVVIAAILVGVYFVFLGGDTTKVNDLIKQVQAQGLTINAGQALDLIRGGSITFTTPDGKTAKVTMPTGDNPIPNVQVQ